MNALHFAGSDFMLESDGLSDDLREALEECGSPGQDASPAVTYVRENFDVTGDPADCAAYLRGYGAWDDTELQDHDTNLDRLVWLTGCSIREGEPAYFSTYG